MALYSREEQFQNYLFDILEVRQFSIFFHLVQIGQLLWALFGF